MQSMVYKGEKQEHGVKKKEKISMYLERIRLVAALALSFFMIEFLLFGGLGIAVPLVVVAFYGLILWQVKGTLREKLSSKLLIPIVLVTISFALFDNELLKVFNMMLLFGLVVLHMGELFGLNHHEAYTVSGGR